ncbi:unnamed protein product, partial [Rotaria socialis]
AVFPGKVPDFDWQPPLKITPFDSAQNPASNTTHVKVSNDFLNELEYAVNHTLANIIRQSNSLGVHAHDLFDELITDAGQFELHHQESVYVSNATSSSQACSIQQSSEEQQYRSSQDFISHCGDYESVAHANILSQQQIYSRANHHLVS